MPERSYRALLWVLALTGLLADQASKYGVFSWLYQAPDHTHVLFGNPSTGGFQLVAQFVTDPFGRPQLNADGSPVPHVNHGAVWGWRLGLSDPRSVNYFFAAVSLLAALAIAYWSFLRTTARDRWLCAALGLILAGTLGNFYDRLVFHGVRDFLHWNYLFDWPVFNIADCCLVTGAALLLIQAFLTPSAPAPKDPAASESAQQQQPAEVAGVPHD